MLEDYISVAVLISIAWIALFAFYFYVSSRQKVLEQELQELQEKVERLDAGERG